MNGYSEIRFHKWGEKKRLNLLAALCIFFFAIAGFTGLALVVILWEKAKVGIIILVVSLIVAFILKRIVNNKEHAFRRADRVIWEKFQQELEKAGKDGEEELDWRWLQYNEFICQGINPQEAYRKAKELEYKAKQ